MNRNLFARLAEGFPSDRSAVFLETPEGAALSFAALLDGAGRVATLLRAAGVAPGDRVAAAAPRAPQMAALYLGCLQVGGVYVPLDPEAAPGETARVLAEVEPRVVVCAPEAERTLAAVAAGVRAALYTLAADGGGRLSETAGALPSERAAAERGGGDLAAVLFAPGGPGVMLTHDNVWSGVATLHWLWGIRPGDGLIHALPLHRADGLLVALNLMLMNGGRVMLAPLGEPAAVAALAPRASLVAAPASDLARLAAAAPSGALEGLRVIALGPEPLSAATRAAIEAQCGARMMEGYRRDETGVAASAPSGGERPAGSVGPALPGMALRVTGQDGAPLGPGETGALEARGAGVFAGYWRDPARTAAAFTADGWLVTGERASIGADGALVLAAEARSCAA